jgi:2-iminobutanoate/2-iminopropanoate deaminase
MERKIINPWTWQTERNYVQAVEVKNVQSTLYVSGQAAVHDDGTSSTEDMKSQLIHALKNLDTVISAAGYENKDIVRLTIYTTATAELWPHFSIFQEWTTKHNVQPSLSLMEVVSLFETLKVEFEATLAK